MTSQAAVGARDRSVPTLLESTCGWYVFTE